MKIKQWIVKENKTFRCEQFLTSTDMDNKNWNGKKKKDQKSHAVQCEVDQHENV